MKKLILILLSIVILSIKSILFAQGLTEPFIVSPFIGEKLDRIEENYFNLCPEIKNFQEATFYLNPNSSLILLTKFKQNNQLIDTTIAYRCILYLN